jgi:hypothetical protein
MAVVSLYTASVVSETLTGPSIFEAATVRMGPGIGADSGAGTSSGTGSGTRTDPMYNKGEQDELRRLLRERGISQERKPEFGKKIHDEKGNQDYRGGNNPGGQNRKDRVDLTKQELGDLADEMKGQSGGRSRNERKNRPNGKW